MYQTFPRLIYSDAGDRTALSSFTSEASLLAGRNHQPIIPSLSMNRSGPDGAGAAYRLTARGSIGTTGAPTFIFTVRMNTTQSLSSVAGTAILVSPTITTNSGVTNGTGWELKADLIVSTAGQGTNNLTISGAGTVISSGFATPVNFLSPTTPPTTTWTATFDSALTYFLMLSATCGTSDASNVIRLKQLLLEELN